MESCSVGFMLEVVSFMESVGVSDLPGSGLSLPASGWCWLDCCRACVWLALSGRELPEVLENRMLLGPANPVVRLYLEWRDQRDEVSLPFDFWELSG